MNTSPTHDGHARRCRLRGSRVAVASLTLMRLALSPVTAAPDNAATPDTRPDRVRLTLEASAASVVIDEPFTLRLRLRIPALADDGSELAPVHPLHAPRLTIPYLEYAPPSGLIRPHVRELLEPRLLPNPRAPGFRINAFTADSSPLAWMAGLREREARFALDHSRLASHRGPEHVYTLDTPFTGDRPGRFTFGPVHLDGHFIIALDARGQAATETVSVQSDPVTVTVTSPPADARPPGYSGAIGRAMSVEAELDAQICNTGDPLTLTLTLRGDVRLDRVTAPPLDSFPALTDAFRVYVSSVRSESGDGLRRFHYTIRPLQAGTLEVPPLPLAYYDIDAHRYRIVRTAPIPVRANRITAAELPGQPGAVRLGTVPDTAVPAPFRVPVSLTPAPAAFAPRLHLPLFAAGPLVWLAMAVTAIRKRRRHASRTARQRRLVMRNIHRRLASLAAVRGPRAADWEHLHQTLADWLTLVAGLPPGTITPQSAARELTARGWPETAARARALLETIAAAVFAAAPPDPATFATVVREVTALVTAGGPADDGGQTGDPGVPTQRLLMCLLLLPIAVATVLVAGPARPGDAVSFRAREAGALVRQAHAPAQFLQVARAYQGLLEAGVVNVDVAYNLGTALLLAERPQAARLALEAAERMGGGDWEIRRNLALAMRETAPPHWSRIVCFWHYRLGLPIRVTLAALTFLALWGGLIASRLTRGPIGPRLAGTAAILFCVCLSSVLLSLRQGASTRALLTLDLPMPALEVAP